MNGHPRERHGATVYRLYNANHDLLYVGMGKPFNRMYQHRISTQWFKQVVFVELDHFDTREQSAIAEAIQIRDLKPKYNKKRILEILSKAKNEEPLSEQDDQ